MLSNPVIAENKKSDAEVCKMFSDTAGRVMIIRQEGVDMSDIYTALDGEMHKALVIEAYKVPRYSTKKSQRREVEEFKNKAFMGCIKIFKSRGDK